MRFLAISGSLRRASINTELLRAAAALAPPSVEVAHFDGLGTLPHFNPDIDTDPPLPPVRALRESVEWADALLISSPEYAHGVPGVLKNALDWLVSGVEIVGKPIGLLSASPRAIHAQSSLAETLQTKEAANRGDHRCSRVGRAVELGGGGLLISASAPASARSLPSCQSSSRSPRCSLPLAGPDRRRRGRRVDPQGRAAQPSPPTVSEIVGQAPAAAPRVEPGD